MFPVDGGQSCPDIRGIVETRTLTREKTVDAFKKITYLNGSVLTTVLIKVTHEEETYIVGIPVTSWGDIIVPQKNVAFDYCLVTSIVDMTKDNEKDILKPVPEEE